jgi:hypothetical protein
MQSNGAPLSLRAPHAYGVGPPGPTSPEHSAESLMLLHSVRRHG